MTAAALCPIDEPSFVRCYTLSMAAIERRIRRKNTIDGFLGYQLLSNL
jgi:hypothetical protein